VSLLFQNKLSTSFATLGYLWDVNDKTGKFKAAYTYRGWYPVIIFREKPVKEGFITQLNREPGILF
jgi:hypothetical protein